MSQDTFDEEELTFLARRHGYTFVKVIGVGGYSICALVKSFRGDLLIFKVSHRISKSVDEKSEVIALTKLQHPNIMRMIENFYEREHLCLILDYYPGGTLEEAIKTKGPLPTAKVLFYFMQIVDALKYIHHFHYAHRDIKPSNILIDKLGRPIICDFGLAQHYGLLSTETRVAGSRAFMAPEMIHSPEYNPYSADIWSLGITLYMMMYGKVPFDHESHLDGVFQPLIYLPETEPDRHQHFLIGILKQMLVVSPVHRISIDGIAQRMEQANINFGAMAKPRVSKIMGSRTPAPIHSMIAETVPKIRPCPNSRFSENHPIPRFHK